MFRQFFSQPQNVRVLRESLYSGMFAMLMLGLISPFNVGDLGDHRYGYFILVGVCTIVVGVLSGLFTAYVLHMPLDPKLPLGKLHRNSAMIYVVNTPVLAAVLTTLNGVYNYDNAFDHWWWNGHFTLVPYCYFLYYVASTSVLMYVGMYVRNRNWSLNAQLDEMRQINKLLEERQDRQAQESEKRADVEEDDEEKPLNGLCRLEGTTRDSVLEVSLGNILYVEAMANYANIWYMDGDTPTKKTLRITLKQIKESLCKAPYLVQCHRAFIVNLNFVLSISNRQNGYQLQMFGVDCPIPISRTYLSMVKERLCLKSSS